MDKKDLRDAYKALTLMRSDLMATKKEKQALEEKWMAFVTQKRLEDAQRRAQVDEMRARFALREEELQSKLSQYEGHTHQKKKEEEETNPPSKQTPSGDDNQTESDGGGDNPEEEEHVEEEDKEKRGETQEKEEQTPPRNNQQDAPLQEQQDEQETSTAIKTEAAMELIFRENLELQAQFQAQANQLLAQEALFVRMRDEWALEKDAFTLEISKLKENLIDLSREKEFMEEKFEFLRSEVDVVKQERDGLLRAQVSEVSEESEDVEISRRELETWKGREADAAQRLLELCGEKDALLLSFRQEQEMVQTLRGEMEDKRLAVDTLTQENANLLQQLAVGRDQAEEQRRIHGKEEEQRTLVQLRERESMQHELTTLLTNFEAMVTENALKTDSLQQSKETLERECAAHRHAVQRSELQAQAAQKKLRGVEQVVCVQKELLSQCRQCLDDQRRVVVHHQTQWTCEMERLERSVCQLQWALEESHVKCHGLEEQMRGLHDEAARTSEESQQRHQQEMEAVQKELFALREATQPQQQEKSVDDYKTHDHHIVQALEQQLMGSHDHDAVSASSSFSASSSASSSMLAASAAAPHASQWCQLPSQIRALDDFLPQLQLFAGRLNSSLVLCAENPCAMERLSSPWTTRSYSSSPSSVDQQEDQQEEDATTLLTDLSMLLQLAHQWKTLFDSQKLAWQVRLVRRRVLSTLSRWFEEEQDQEEGAATVPLYTLDSHEVRLILQNWTSDPAKQERAVQWLHKIATWTKDNEEAEEDALLALTQMTRAVKDAFCLLVVPLLRQNKHVVVRVFTRRVANVKSSYSPEETCWEMKIHVQFTGRSLASPSMLDRGPHPVTSASCTGPSTSPIAASASATGSAPPQLRRLSSSSSSISSVDSYASSVASSLSLSSISSASKLQIIHARLQQMQQP